MIGQKFGRLTILSREPSDKNGRSMWLCQCDCGKKGVWILKNLRNGNTKSCGCFRVEKRFKHGRADMWEPTYKAWVLMKMRCYNVNGRAYHRYGGRGIQVCLRWFDFKNFLTDMGEKPAGLTLERIDNDLHYMPGNCRWATWKEQAANRSPHPRRYFATINGETKALLEWEELMGFKHNSLLQRRNRGWKDEDLLKPFQKR